LKQNGTVVFFTSEEKCFILHKRHVLVMVVSVVTLDEMTGGVNKIVEFVELLFFLYKNLTKGSCQHKKKKG